MSAPNGSLIDQECQKPISEITKEIKTRCSQKKKPAVTSVPCSTGTMPDIHPNFQIRWGDSDNDNIETEDEEVLCIVASNPYSNIVFKNLIIVNIALAFIDDDGTEVEVPVNNDGTHAVTVIPSGMIYFGDLLACDNEPSSVPREVYLRTTRTIPGNYRIGLCYQYSIEFEQKGTQVFDFEFVLS